MGVRCIEVCLYLLLDFWSFNVYKDRLLVLLAKLTKSLKVQAVLDHTDCICMEIKLYFKLPGYTQGK